MRFLKSFILLCTVFQLYSSLAVAQLTDLKKGFKNPRDAYKPGVYWYFMDGNLDAERMIKDLESMKAAGIGNLIFLEVNVGIPRGKVDFLSDQWLTLFAYAEKEARRLGIEITLGVGPGWTGSGGPWVTGEQSMQHLVSSELVVTSTGSQKIVLPVPAPKAPFFGEGGLTEEVEKQWKDFYQDVAVLAFPVTGEIEKIGGIDEKALYYRAPYSSGTVLPFLPEPSNDKKADKGIAKAGIIDLTDKLLPDGSLNWFPHSGKWKIMRFGSRNNGAITRPAPFPGLGFESDKLDTLALNAHLANYVGKILNKIGKLEPGKPGGLKRLHMDSWEMGAQNWTPQFRKEFLKRRGYDPVKYYPVYSGYIVGTKEESERFLWDLRLTAQELVLQNHAMHIKKYARRLGLELSIEPYDMTPTSDLELGSIADVPMAEFWSKGYGFNATYSVIEATSVAHVGGKSLVPAEAFTAQNNEGWKQHPGSMKNQGDWAFAAGINRLVYHTFQNQFLPDSLKPGATMGPYGIHWDRNQTWWPMVSAYHTYVSRCQYLLQQGRTVADVLYLTPEGAPHVFVPPASAIDGDTTGNRRGYNFDGCSPTQLMSATVKEGKVAFPGGANYQVLVLPAYKTMTPALLSKIGELISLGATVVGGPPSQSPSLSGYPDCDAEVASLSKKIWGTLKNPEKQSRRNYGKGSIIWGGTIATHIDNLYPDYGVVSTILKAEGIGENFIGEGIRYTHRTSDDWDNYFIANIAKTKVSVVARFRSIKGAPALWNAVTGKITPIYNFKVEQGYTSIPLVMDSFESCFILFSSENSWEAVPDKQVSQPMILKPIDGPWTVNFDPKWGGPASINFDTLIDWSKHHEDGIRYYSGTATYSKIFHWQRSNLNYQSIYLDLGKVKNMARVTLNGKELGVLWTAPWKIDISRQLRSGENDLKIEVINLWSNRLIGDEKKPDDGIKDGKWPGWLTNNEPRSSGRYTFATSRQYNADSPLEESGLIGPVTVVCE